jgi:tRNA(fMet)-specific endonuclease VapC
MLDTDISSYIIRRRPASIHDRFRKLDSGQLCISVITQAELRYGILSAGAGKGIRPAVEDFLDRLTILDWNGDAAEHYAEIRFQLERAGAAIGSLDMLIAAHARSVNAVLVTNNERHFRRISRLAVENWVKPA